MKPSAWFRLHRNTGVLTVTVALAGVACSLAYQHGRRGTVLPVSQHAKLGVAAAVLLCAQPVNALLRPRRPDPLRRRLALRFAWLVFHRCVAAAARRWASASPRSSQARLGHNAATLLHARACLHLSHQTKSSFAEGWVCCAAPTQHNLAAAVAPQK